MNDSVALQRYLQRHIERDLPPAPRCTDQWQRGLVIPAYGEPPALLDSLCQLPAGPGRTLVILVLNRPDSASDYHANDALRNAIAQHAGPAGPGQTVRLNQHADLLLHDLEQVAGPTPAAMGVGLARKTGCDIAVQWMDRGAISGDWVYSSDADAALPPDYFHRLETGHHSAPAAVYPFCHRPGPDNACNRATALYELRLHHYVLGLELAGSPYACHTLGSCLAVRAQAYTQVRGFPRRAAGEDFYLLNKLAKLGPIMRLDGACVELQSRASPRVPFGTGPAVQKIMAADAGEDFPLFYHPACFTALRSLLRVIPGLREGAPASLPELLCNDGLETVLAQASHSALTDMGIADALDHCRRQGTDADQFSRQFHQWFDGFRTLKFIHALRTAGWPLQSLADLQGLQPDLWPVHDREGATVAALRRAVRQYWRWTIPSPDDC